MPYFLELCIQSVAAAISNIEAEIIVVDNLSQDTSCVMVQQKYPEVKLIENKENFGFSKGNNIGVANAQGEYICILNPDTVVAEDTFETLLSYIEKKNKIGIIGCKLIDGIGNYLPESKRNIPVPKIAIKKALGNTNSYYANHIEENATGKVSIFVGAFMLLKKITYIKVKGFDEDYFMYGEDIDLSYKIEKNGYQNYYVGASTIIHYKGESTLKDETYAKRFYGAMRIFYKKHFKRNFFFDSIMFLGIWSAKFLSISNSKSLKEKAPMSFVIVSNNDYPNLEQKLKSVVYTKKVISFASNTEYVLDANYLSFKEIIRLISTSKNKKNITFKILPKNSNFIIGSNSSKSRGKVIVF